MGETLDAKIKEQGKFTISNLVRNSDLNIKLATLATKTELKAQQDKIVNRHSIDTSKNLLIAIKFQHGNQQDCLIKVLNLLLNLIIVLLQG